MDGTEGLYTIAFSDPRFTAQLRMLSVGNVNSAVESAPWFQETIGTFLGLAQDEEPQHFQLVELDGLTNTWSGFIGHQGRYASFVLVRACSCQPTEPGYEFKNP